MFDSFLKRPTQGQGGKQPTPAPGAEQAGEVTADASAAERQAAMLRAQACANDEAAAAQFILQCEFADARFEAAQHVHSKAALEQVLQGMRNADRRVARLMQQRLDQIERHDADETRAAQCIARAQLLAADAHLLVNQVAELDHEWEALGELAPATRDAYGAVRAQLSARLDAQTELQRAVLELRQRLRQQLQQAQASADDNASHALDEIEQELARLSTAPEAPALPRHLLAEIAQEQQAARTQLQTLATREAAVRAHEAAYAAWEAQSPDRLKEEELQQAARALPHLSEQDAAPFAARMHALRERIAASRKARGTAARETRKVDQQPFLNALAALEEALANGALHSAAEHDKALRAMDFKPMRLTEAQHAELVRARAELTRLQGWARWGGKVSREELLKAALELPGQKLAAAELAKKVGSLRERWKALDAASGAAGKDIWHRFDAACTAAYGIAAEHFKRLAEERQRNLDKAHAVIAQVKEFAARTEGAPADAADWKAIAAFVAKSRDAWQRLGAIDRKERKAADTEFNRALAQLQQPLAAQQQRARQQRELLVERAAALDPADRHALDTLRGLQEQWQAQARALPLERKVEHALWQRFRTACDALFAQRKEVAKEADAVRHQHLHAREELCAALEAATVAEPAAIAKLLRETRSAWERAGEVPRALQKKIEGRYAAACHALQQRAEQSQRKAASARLDALRARLALCHQLERQVAEQAGADAEQLGKVEADWQAQGGLNPEWERTLQARFAAARKALQEGDNAYRALLQKNGAELSREVLRLEILLGQHSPPELARERLKLQVEVLQSSLKAGQKPATPEAQLLRLCALPAVTDAATAERIGKLIARVKSAQIAAS